MLLIATAVMLVVLLLVSLNSDFVTGGVKMSRFYPYTSPGEQVAYEAFIYHNRVAMGSVAITGKGNASAAFPIMLHYWFVSNATGDFEFNCASLGIAQTDSSLPTRIVYYGGGYADLGVILRENDTSSARVFSFCDAQQINNQGWAEYEFEVIPNGTSPLIITATLTMTQGETTVTRVASVELDNLTLS